MDTLATVVANSFKKTGKEVSTSTITFRLPDTELNNIDEAAATLDITRQDLLSLLVKEGLTRTQELIEEQYNREDSNPAPEPPLYDFVAGSPKYYILNTNTKHGMKDHNEMLEEQAASAFFGDVKACINWLQRGDRVFLYQNGIGIIAAGIATGETIVSAYYDDDVSSYEDEKRSQKLNEFCTNFLPITAKYCKDLTKSNITFLRTMTPLSEKQGEALWSEIEKRRNDKK